MPTVRLMDERARLPPGHVACGLIIRKDQTVSTPSERLEAEVWLDAILPDLPPELREKFFVGVDEYYIQYPTADRSPDVLATLKDDNQAFALILQDVIPEGEPLATAVSSVLDARSR